MAGGGNRKDESVVNSTNVFAALDTLRKKKKSEKSKQGSSKPNSKQLEAQKEVFWAPAPLTVKSWADVDDDDDDDYYATTAPPVSAWDATPDANHANEEAAEVSESEEEGLDEVDDDIEEEHENDDKLEASLAVEPIIKKPSEASSSNKEPERQLSKKELKKKGLEELDAVLAELGYAKQDTGGQDDSHEEKQENSLDVEKKENVPGESKSSKKKKKKEKMSKEDKESEEQSQGTTGLGQGTSEAGETEKADDATGEIIDMKARLKKVASSKKKKSNKEIDAAAKAAAVEAAARRAKLAAAKKKEKTHYNQQPVR
ncbi:copper ion binding [Euphorbia peplus]|nr:copper ion binding [Euphorbia peplus]